MSGEEISIEKDDPKLMEILKDLTAEVDAKKIVILALWELPPSEQLSILSEVRELLGVVPAPERE